VVRGVVACRGGLSGGGLALLLERRPATPAGVGPRAPTISQKNKRKCARVTVTGCARDTNKKHILEYIIFYIWKYGFTDIIFMAIRIYGYNIYTYIYIFRWLWLKNSLGVRAGFRESLGIALILDPKIV